MKKRSRRPRSDFGKPFRNTGTDAEGTPCRRAVGGGLAVAHGDVRSAYQRHIGQLKRVDPLIQGRAPREEGQDERRHALPWRQRGTARVPSRHAINDRHGPRRPAMVRRTEAAPTTIPGRGSASVGIGPRPSAPGVLCEAIAAMSAGQNRVLPHFICRRSAHALFVRQGKTSLVAGCTRSCARPEVVLSSGTISGMMAPKSPAISRTQGIESRRECGPVTST